MIKTLLVTLLTLFTTVMAALPAPAARPTEPSTRQAALQTTETPAPTLLPTSTPFPTPTPRPEGTPPRVAIQVGHLRSNELPDELARLRGSTGAFAGGISEVEVNEAVANRVAELLRARGIVVDVLPATVPPSYDADAFVALHADGSTSTRSRGFKLATPWRASQAAIDLMEALRIEYAAATKLPEDYAITVNMRGYYAFAWSRHTHAVARTTPPVILEMGFLTNPTDRDFMTRRADLVATGIANGIIRYLNQRDPKNGAALLPPVFRVHRPIGPEGVKVRAAPNDKARVIATTKPDARISIFREKDGWYECFVRGESGRVIGWVRKDQVVETNDPTPTPLPVTDS